MDCSQNTPRVGTQMRGVDAFLCHHAAGLCEAFMPLNKSLVVVASTRYEIGRHDPSRWRLWNDNLRRIAAHPRNVVAANNHYDAAYVKYFTGLRDVPVIPNFCAYTQVQYRPTRPQVLVGPGRGVHAGLFAELQLEAKRAGGKFKNFATIRDLYPHYEYSDLAAHPAIVLIPYQVSVMSFFEYYRMAIPMFAPTPELLAQWQLRHTVMNELTWDLVFKKPKGRKAPLPQHPADRAAGAPPHDPNNQLDAEALRYWLGFADFYQWPHIEYFSSWPDLLKKLDAADLPETSRRIAAHNVKQKEELIAQWQALFHRMFEGIPPASASPRPQEADFDRAMARQYRVKVAGACTGDTDL